MQWLAVPCSSDHCSIAFVVGIHTLSRVSGSGTMS